MTSRNERTIRVGLAIAAAKPCLMCGGPAQLAGMFQPADSEVWGSRPGKQRILFYALCDPCHDRTSLDAIEAQIALGMGRAA
jgi:hypothetical protein